MENKIVVITGASSGIGAALAERVSQVGGKPVLAARREKELREVATRCGPAALTVIADVRRREDVTRLFDAALGRFGRIDVWVNNAGRGITRSVAELTDEDVDEMMRVNLKSALYGIQTVLPHFQERGEGHIINVSSMLGRIAHVPERSAYNAAKHALNALTTSLRLDLRETHPGIHVSVVMPGVVHTDFGNHALHGGVDSRALPFGQSAAEVAQVIADLIQHPRAEIYTRPQFRDQVASYYAAERVETMESQPPFARPGAPAH